MYYFFNCHNSLSQLGQFFFLPPCIKLEWDFCRLKPRVTFSRNITQIGLQNGFWGQKRHFSEKVSQNLASAVFWGTTTVNHAKNTDFPYLSSGVLQNHLFGVQNESKKWLVEIGKVWSPYMQFQWKFVGLKSRFRDQKLVFLTMWSLYQQFACFDLE